jgi:hypothetical protein
MKYAGKKGDAIDKEIKSPLERLNGFPHVQADPTFVQYCAR